VCEASDLAARSATRPEVQAVTAGSIQRAAALLRNGSLVAFPTETVYGLGASIDHPDALRRIFTAKGRPTADPLIVHLADAASAESFIGDWPAAAAELAARCWPGPLTLIVRRPAGVPDLVCAGGATVGIRVPQPVGTRAMLAQVGSPVAAPSANRFGRISPTTAAHVVAEFGGPDVSDRPDLILDGGPCTLGVESTVVDLTGPDPVVRRPGGVSVEDLEAWIGPLRLDHRAVQSDDVTAALRSPGEYEAHYAPNAPVIALDAVPGIAALVADAAVRSGRRAVSLDLPADPDRAAQTLFGRLRSLDESAPELIVAELLDDTGVGRAVNDRLRRAAHGRLVTADRSDTIEEILESVAGLLGW